jgi:hypothetical protein
MEESLIREGYIKAKAISAQLGKSSKKGTPQVEVRFEIYDGEDAGKQISWYGYFPESSQEASAITIETLRTCGWNGDDLRDLSTIEGNFVSLKIVHETWEKKKRAKVKYINEYNEDRANGTSNAMSPDEAASFAKSMRGLVLAKSPKKKTEEPKAKVNKTKAKLQAVEESDEEEDQIPF